MFDPGNKFLERYLIESAQFVKSEGIVYLAYLPTHGDVSKMKAIAKRYNWNVKLLAPTGNEDSIIVQLYEFKQTK